MLDILSVVDVYVTRGTADDCERFVGITWSQLETFVVFIVSSSSS